VSAHRGGAALNRLRVIFYHTVETGFAQRERFPEATRPKQRCGNSLREEHSRAMLRFQTQVARPQLLMRGAGARGSRRRCIWQGLIFATTQRQPQTVQVDVHDRRGEEREHLTDDQTANDGDA